MFTVCCSKLTVTCSQLVQARQLAQRLLDRWDPPHWPRHRFLDASILADRRLECHLLFRHRTGYHRWLPPAMCVCSFPPRVEPTADLLQGPILHTLPLYRLESS